jgi:hypothetical protein
LWSEIVAWLGKHKSAPDSGDMWTAMSNVPSASTKGLRSLIILVCWEVWKEMNDRVFERANCVNYIVMQKNIKDDARL